VVNAREARWRAGHFGAFAVFEDRERAEFDQLGINIGVLRPGQPNCHYHGEADQEDFLVLSGESLLLIEGEERRLKQWDFVHCPPWTEHVLIGAGDRPCVVLAVGSRTSDDIVYPASELAQRYGAGAAKETKDPAESYAGIPRGGDVKYDESWLG
jgi:uncharacterized cupin superfamily protein